MAEPVSEASSSSAATQINPPPGVWTWIFRGCAIGLGLFSLWAAGPGIPEQHFQLALYLLLTWTLSFILYAGSPGMIRVAPDPTDWLVGLVLIASGVAAVLRAEPADADGARLFDYAIWAVGVGAAAVALLRPGARMLALIGFSLFTLGYYVHEFDAIILRPGAWTATDFWVAAIAIALSLEVARRGLGWWIPGIAIAALIYAHFGYLIPGSLGHRGSSINQIVNYIMYSQEGLFGIMTSVMATYVIVFIFLGAFMERSGMGRFFIEMPLALAGRTAGGPAKVAVIASALFGSISGASLANIVATGAFTIPLMKRVGFKPHVAGAVENTASLGGQILPPVMGSGAFVMSEITGVPYSEIVVIAFLPALLYMLSIGLIVHFEALRTGVRGMAPGEVATPGEVLRRGWFHIVPFVVLLGFLFAGYSPDWCAVMSIISILLINWTRIGLGRLLRRRFDMPEDRLGLRGILDALVIGGRNSLVVGSVAAAVGIIVGVVALTGLGLKMSHLLVGLSGGNLFFMVVLVALASLLLGMALPITASYLVLVVLAGPALQELGVALIAAHMIVFWLSQDSNITPPVCLGAYVAASIAGADPWKTGWTSFRFAKMLYVMPLLFAFTPILMTGTAAETAWVMVTATVGTLAFAGWTMGWFYRRTTYPEWAVLGIATVFCFLPAALELPGGVEGWHLNVIGILAVAALFRWQRARLPIGIEADTSVD